MPEHRKAAPKTEVLNSLKQILGQGGWHDPCDAPRYFEDPRGRFTGQGCLIVMPRSVSEVSAIVRICDAEGIGIVPYSGGTGVVAGQLSVARADVIILSLERMNKIREMSVDDGVMVAEAGCILQDVHDVAEDHEMVFPLSMASKGSCCIGGNLATNAGGIQVVRYGNARDLCLGVEAVLPDGAVLNELNPLHKNNTGYDMRHLLIGSEGTLGIITAACLKLHRKEAQIATALLAIASPAQGLAVFRELRAHLGGSISALELMSGFGLDLVTESFAELRPPFAKTPEWALLLEVSGPIGTQAQVEAALQVCFDKDLLLDAVVAQSESQRARLWELRERTPEANGKAGAFCNSDTSVAVSKVPAFIAETTHAIAAIHPGLLINSYGHVGDGNIHHNVFPPKGIPKADFVQANAGVIDQVRLAINDVTHAHGGSISAEHGIGRLKADDLQHYASAARYDALKRIKAALDPKGIMNPSALIP